MYLGIDLGTSAIKVVLINQDGQLLDSFSEPLTISRPAEKWSEQSPDQWWQATLACMAQLSLKHNLKGVKAIGLSGQMHGAVLLDDLGQPLRPAILWNDGRSEHECSEIEINVPTSRTITGNMMMPGFTAPKLLWVKKHEPDCFAKISKVLLPKDYLSFKLTGCYVSDMSDASGTLWLDVANRCWNEELLQACGLNTEQMPALLEGNQSKAQLLPKLAEQWGMGMVPVAAGAGDNAAGAIGVGLTEPGQAMLSLGTSGVYFLVSDGYYSNPEAAVHSFCHALPNRWHLMSVCLSAASCLQWFADNIAFESVATLLADLTSSTQDFSKAPIFLPYLSGERTPHNNPNATGAFVGLTHDTNRTLLTYAIVEGISFALRDGLDAVHMSGLSPKEINLIGGAARSGFWRQLLADCLNHPITFKAGNEVGPALGAALLAKSHLTGDVKARLAEQVEVALHQPNMQRHQLLNRRYEQFKALYPAISASTTLKNI